MSNNKIISSGTLFVRFASIGLLTLFSAVIFLKYSNIAGKNTSIALGAVIFFVNLFSVLGYTKAVLKNPNVLAESDSPDLAYYLGFSLTVGALSATFITDTLISQFASQNTSSSAAAAIQSELIKSSLIQFGVGLTATLIGLSAKVYLASKQAEGTLEIEEFYRKFRMEIQNFQHEIQSATTSYSKTLEENMIVVKSAMESIKDSFLELSEVAKRSNEIIGFKLGEDEIGKPIAEFSNAIKSFNNSTKGLADSSQESVDTFKSLSSTLSAMENSFIEVTNSAKSLISETTQLSTSTQDLTDSTTSASISQKNISSEIASMSTNIKSATANTESLSDSTLTLKNNIVKTENELSQFSNHISSLNNSFNMMSNYVSNFDDAIQKSTANLNLNNENGTTLSSETEKLQINIGKIANELSLLESKLKRLNQIQ